MKNCDALCCKNTSVTSAANSFGDEYHACAEHAQYLAGWIYEDDYVARCESREAAARSDYELDYYAGRD